MSTDSGERGPQERVPVFAEELRAAIARRDLSLSEIRRRLAAHRVSVSLATLSQWRSGARVPQSTDSLRVVGALEEVLDLEPNVLWDLLSVPLDGGRSIGRYESEHLAGFSPAVADAMAELGLLELQFDEVSVHVSFDVGVDRCIRSINTKQVMRARRAGAQRMAVFVVLDETTDEFAQFTAVSGCVTGRRAERRADGVAVVELIFPAPLARNDTALYETQVELAPYPVADSDCFNQVISSRIAQGILEARFHPDQLPHAGEAFTSDRDGTEANHTPRAVRDHLHNIVHDFGPGQINLRWWWT